MAKQKPGKTRLARLIKTVVIVVIFAIAGLIGINYLLPMLTSDSITTYESYTVETGDIETVMNFSADLEVRNSETFRPENTTKVKEIYVTSGDTVSEGDELVLLSDGELFTAGFDGVVNEIRVSVGDWVRENFGVVQVSDLVNLSVTMSVDEYDVKSLYVGENCTVKVISLGEEFETTIAHINRVSSSSGTLAYYTVTCNLTAPAEVLPGMRSVVIIPDEAAVDVLTLPVAALSFTDDGQAFTLRKTADGAYENQPVETGLSDGTRVEILSGLQSGDTVYAASGTQSAQAPFSLEDLYIALVGRKVVINETGGQRRGTESDFTEMPSAFADRSADAAAGADSAGFTPPASGTIPGTGSAAGDAVPSPQTAQDVETSDTNTQP